MSRSGSNNPGFFSFYNFDGTTENLALRIGSSGDVGIKTGSPADELHVVGKMRVQGTSNTIGGNYCKVYQNANSTIDYGLRLKHYDGTSDESSAGIDIGGSTSSTKGHVHFRTSQDTTGNNDTVKMTIAPSGKVGIGDTSPSRTLTLKHNTQPQLGWYVGTQESLRIQCTGSANYFDNLDNHNVYYRVGTTGTNIAMQLNANGRVVLGNTTSNPLADLEIKKAAGVGFPAIYVSQSRSASTTSDIALTGNAVIKSDSLRFAHTNTGTTTFWYNAGTAVTNGTPTGSLEAMRVNSSGNFLIHTTNENPSETVFGSAFKINNYFRHFRDIDVNGGVATIGGNSGKANIYGDGTIKNTSNVYGQISDEKFKENIVDAQTQWDDIKAVQVRNFNFKESTGWTTITQIGVIAQELEQVSPGLVQETIDEETDETSKSVKYSVLYMKAVKALQEAMTRIETLEAKVAALEAAV